MAASGVPVTQAVIGRTELFRHRPRIRGNPECPKMMETLSHG